MTREEYRDYVEFLRSQDEISYDVYSGLIDGIDTLEQEPKTDNELDMKLKLMEANINGYTQGLKDASSTEQEPYDFAKWVATEIFDEWEYNKDAFAEIACRKLAKLGIVRAKGDEWELVEPQESEDKE